MRTGPFEIAGIAAYPTRQAWDAAATEILGTVLTRWNLTIDGAPFTGGQGGTVLRVRTESGGPAVLKVGFPHEEAVYEAVGLAALPPGTAPAVLRQDPWSWALLLEEILPGDPLSRARLPTVEALRCGGALLARIAATGPVAGLPALAEVVHGYASVARARWDGHRSRLERLGATDLVAAAIDELDALADGGLTTGFVHGDFNPGNILRAGGGWAVIDPKPMTGDPCYDLWPLVSQLGSPFTATDPVAALTDQLTHAADSAGLDPVRCARWAFARSGLNVSWYLAEDEHDYAAADAGRLRHWVTVRSALVG